MNGSISRSGGSLLLVLFAVGSLGLTRDTAAAQWASTGGPGGGDIVSLSADDRYVYAGTAQGHVWRRPLAEIIAGIEASPAGHPPPSRIDVTAFPNPCNASTMLSILLPTASDVTLSLCDLLGRKIETLISGHLEAGSYRVPIDMKTFASGLYVALLQTGNRRLARRIMLVR
jgi:hypothetical protein